jgi:hypothetical protein
VVSDAGGGAGSENQGRRFPLTTAEGWRGFVDDQVPEPKQLSGQDLELLTSAGRAAHDAERLEYHARLIVAATPVVRHVYATGRRLVLLNRHEISASRGLIVTGAPGTGKTTAVTQLGRNYELLQRARLGPAAMRDRMPVVYVTVPPAATPKMLATEFAVFAGLQPHPRQNQTAITNAVCDVLARVQAGLVIVDETHNLDLGTRLGADSSDQLKYLAERIRATFVYAGINAAAGGLFAGIRGQQIAGRFGAITCENFGYRTEAQRKDWKSLVLTFDQALRLRQHPAGHLVTLDAYLHERTNGMIGSLSHLIRGAAVEATLDGTEKITKRMLDAVGLDQAAGATRRTRRSSGKTDA